MDVASLFSGLRALTPGEASDFAASKLNSLELAYARLSKSEELGSFEAFVDSLPPSLLSTVFATRGLDQHYTTLLAGLCAGKPEADVWLITTLNYVLQGLTYQGRYLGRAWPEVFITQGPDTFNTSACVANTDRVANFRIAPSAIEADETLARRMDAFAMNAGPFITGEAAALAPRIPQAPARTIGCLAFTDLKSDLAQLAEVRATLESLSGSLTDDTTYVFAGDTAVVLQLHAALASSVGGRTFLRAYNLPLRGASLHRAILVIDNLASPLVLPEVRLEATDSFTVAYGGDLAKGKADGLAVVTTHLDEEIKLQRPVILSSGAPLSDEQTSILTTSLVIHHIAGRLRNGRYITSKTPHNATHIVATEKGVVVEPLHEPNLFRASPYYAPDSTTTIELPRRPVAHVSGPCIPLAFSPSIHAYHSHFLLQCFPRLSIARALGIFDTFHLLAPDTLRGYQREMLRYAGLREDQIVFMDPAYDYQCEELIVPNVIPAIFTPFYTGVYDRLIAAMPHDGAKPHRRILISRAARTTWRNMVNYDAICELLVRECGFEVVSPEKLSLEDEIKLFQSAAIVVGAEGAGLYNCCFMSPETDVVCLADQDYVMYVLGSIAHHRGFDISFVFGESFQADRDLTRRAGHADFVVDPLRVKACVEDLIERRGL